VGIIFKLQILDVVPTEKAASVLRSFWQPTLFTDNWQYMFLFPYMNSVPPPNWHIVTVFHTVPDKFVLEYRTSLNYFRSCSFRP